jgi:Domain of unknown function (DUF4279)
MSELEMEEARDSYRATFVIQEDDLDLEAISNALKLSPTHTHRKGDLSRLGKAYPHDMWALTAPIPNNEPLDSHLKWLSSQLEPKYSLITALKDKADIYIYCGYTTDKEQSEFSISPEALAIFGKLGIPINISILAL